MNFSLFIPCTCVFLPQKHLASIKEKKLNIHRFNKVVISRSPYLITYVNFQKLKHFEDILKKYFYDKQKQTKYQQTAVKIKIILSSYPMLRKRHTIKISSLMFSLISELNCKENENDIKMMYLALIILLCYNIFLY